jgi:hypothetical protein
VPTDPVGERRHPGDPVRSGRGIVARRIEQHERQASVVGAGFVHRTMSPTNMRAFAGGTEPRPALCSKIAGLGFSTPTSWRVDHELDARPSMPAFSDAPRRVPSELGHHGGAQAERANPVEPPRAHLPMGRHHRPRVLSRSRKRATAVAISVREPRRPQRATKVLAHVAAQ